MGPVSIYPGILWQQRTFDKQVVSTIDDSVSTYAGSLGVKFGMVPFMLEAEGQYGRNWGNTHSTIDVSSVGQWSGIQAYGVSVPISLAKGFTVRPEVMWYDDGNENTAYNNASATQSIVDSGKYGHLRCTVPDYLLYLPF